MKQLTCKIKQWFMREKLKSKKKDILEVVGLLLTLCGLTWLAYTADINSGMADVALAKKLFEGTNFELFDNCTVELKSSNSMMMTENSDEIVDANGNVISSELFENMQVLMTVDLDIKSDINGNEAHTYGTQSVTQTDRTETASLDDYITDKSQYSYVEADDTWVKSEYDEKLQVMAYVIDKDKLNSITDIEVNDNNKEYYVITGKILGQHLNNDESLGDFELIKALENKPFEVELHISKTGNRLIYERVELLETASVESGYKSELQSVTYEFKYSNFGGVDVNVPDAVVNSAIDYEIYVKSKTTSDIEEETQPEETEINIGEVDNIELNGMNIDIPEECYAVKANISGLDGIAITDKERTENIAVLVDKSAEIEKHSGKTTFMENSVDVINKLLESDDMTTNLLGLIQETDGFYTQVMAISDAWIFTVGVKESNEVYVVIAYRTAEYSVDRHDIEHLLLSLYNELNENTDANAELVATFMNALYTEKEETVSENSVETTDVVETTQDTSDGAMLRGVQEPEDTAGAVENLASEMYGVDNVDKERLEELTGYKFSDTEATELVNLFNNYSMNEFNDYLSYWQFMGTANKKACAWVVKLDGVESVDRAVELGANKAELEEFLKGLSER